MSNHKFQTRNRTKMNRTYFRTKKVFCIKIKVSTCKTKNLSNKILKLKSKIPTIKTKKVSKPRNLLSTTNAMTFNHKLIITNKIQTKETKKGFRKKTLFTLGSKPHNLSKYKLQYHRKRLEKVLL